MPLPNLLIAGAQKGGTTWLHEALAKSDQFFTSKPKELGFFNRLDSVKPKRIAWYESHFPATDGVTYYVESTPHYFRVPKGERDTARNVAQVLDDPRVIVILRHPVERYLSAYTHHMHVGRRDYAQVIDEITDDFGMMTLGMYGASLEHWRQYVSDIKVAFYDDLKADPVALMKDLMAHLGLSMDLTAEDLDFRTNTRRAQRSRFGFRRLAYPTLSVRAATALMEHYDQDMRRLEELVGRDLSHWREGIPARTVRETGGTTIPRNDRRGRRRRMSAVPLQSRRPRRRQRRPDGVRRGHAPGRPSTDGAG